MLRITVNKSAAGAKKYYSEKYYSEGHDTQRYYSENGEYTGLWYGKAAQQLGLSRNIKKEDFASLCDNLIPGSDKNLTARTNEERRVGYDFTFNASKSVSLAYTFGSKSEKQEILKAFQQAVKETMAEMEKAVQTRIRKGGANENRETGNIAYGEFVHFTSRPVDGVTDPHLHAHCFAFNTTYDQVERKWKAADFGQINKDAPYYEAIFHSKLAEKLENVGYNIKNTKSGFEIAGIERNTIEKFSRRTEEIEKIAEQKDITNINEKAALGAKTRESKRESISEKEQLKEWDDRLSKSEKKIIESLKLNTRTKYDGIKESEIALRKAVDHHLERKSVATDKEILATALKLSIGKATFEQLEKTYQRTQQLNILYSKKEGFETFVTSKEALLEENNLIINAYATKGRFKPIHESYEIKASNLTTEQKNAVQHALTTSDGVTIIAGKAGTGKTTLMREVQCGIRESGKKIFAFAPSAEASRVVQRKEGFENAETLTALIKNKALQEKIKNSVIWIDEAGMVSNKQMNAVLNIAREQNARIILTGDIKQHNSVERGDAQRILQKEAGIIPIEVSKIQRQKSHDYKEAVSALSKADTAKGFKRLDKIGAIKEVEDSHERINAVATDYVTSTHGRKSKPKEVIVIAPTHAEGDKVNQKIREQLKEKQIISVEDKSFKILKSAQLTHIEKQVIENYKEGHIIVFHQNAKGFRAGSKYEVAGVNKDHQLVIKDANGKQSVLSTEQAKCFNVFDQKSLHLAKGDKVRITGNGKSLEGKNLFNGIMYKVTGFDKQGNIKLSNGSSISKDYGHFSHGYVITSHASQGKTVDKVIISQSSMSFRASSQEQFYVSVSRGRQAVAIYTDDKKDLMRAISQTNERQSARELLKAPALLEKATEVNRLRTIKDLKEKIKGFIKDKLQDYGLQRNTPTKNIIRNR